MMKRVKFGLVGILLGLFGLTCFSNAGESIIPLVGGYGVTRNGGTYNISSGTCIVISDADGCYPSEIYDSSDVLLYSGALRYIYCMSEDGYFKNNSRYSCRVDVYSNLVLSCPECQECETCPEINTGDILSGSCDTNYCVENDLCPVPSNFSQLYINDIEHQSAPLIDITIPEEYSRDYSVDSGTFDLVISGYNVDYEYIDNIIRTQKTNPNDTDFNNIITGLIPLFIPGLVIILFIWFIFRFIKKIF